MVDANPKTKVGANIKDTKKLNHEIGPQDNDKKISFHNNAQIQDW